jgi:hypothetical protein
MNRKLLLTIQPIILNFMTVALLVFTSKSSVAGNFKKAVIYETGARLAGAVAIADVNGDGKPDLLVASGDNGTCSACGGTLSVLLGNGDGTFQKAVTYESGGRTASSLAVMDVNGDGHLDVVVTNGCGSDCNSSSVGVLLGNGDGTFRSPTVYQSAGRTGPLALADINGDGKPDIVTAGVASNSDCSTVVGVLLGNGDGSFQSVRTLPSVGCGGLGIVVADVNRDGRPDLVTLSRFADSQCCSYPSELGVLLGKGDGTFEAPRPIHLNGFAHGFATSLATADLNGDGNPDLLVTYAADLCGNCLNGGLWVLLGNRDGTFQPTVSYGTGGSFPFSVVAVDANGDGKLDLMIANHCCLAINLSLRFGNGDGTFVGGFPSQYYFPGGSGVGTLASADLNGDSFQDVVVTIEDQDAVGAVAVLLNNTITTSTTRLTATPNPSLIRQPVTLTARVSAFERQIPDGELVTFYDGATAIASIPLAAGTATFTTSSLSAKTHYIKAAYPGDRFLKPSAGTIIQVVAKYPTTTTLMSSPRPSIAGQPVIFTVTVKSSGPFVPTGKVKFMDFGFQFGFATLSDGVASFTYSKLLAGTHAITAEYVGDTTSANSASPVLNQVVK